MINRNLLSILTGFRLFWLLLPLIVISALFDLVGLAVLLDVARSILKDQNSIILSFIPMPSFFFRETNFLVFFVVAWYFTSSLISLSVTWLSALLTARFGMELGNRIFRHFVFQSDLSVRNINVSKITAQITTEAQRVSTYVLGPALVILARVVTCVAVTSFLLYLQPWWVVFAGCTLLSFYTVIVICSSRPLTDAGMVVTRASASRLIELNQLLRAPELIYLRGLRAWLNKRFVGHGKELSTAQAKSHLVSQLPKSFFDIIFVIFVAYVLWSIATDLNGNEFQVDEILIFLAGAVKILPALQQSFQSVSHISANYVAFQNMDLSRLENDGVDRFGDYKNAIDLIQDDTGGSALRIQAVNLTKEFDDKRGFVDMNFEFLGNGIHIIAGPSGSGKSTLAKSLCGLVDCDRGSIFLNGLKIKDQLDSRRFSIEYLAQDPYFADGSVLENISFGCEVDPKKAEDALLKVRLSHIKLDSILMGNADRLSAGEKQRLALARAIYWGSDILILDEPTSNLDNNTEKEILQLLSELSVSFPIILITHGKLPETNIKSLLDLSIQG